jgi:hypothetical protein
MAYLAAVMAHPAFTARFKSDLVRPGLHVPLTANAELFAEAILLGSEIIWLHCYVSVSRIHQPAGQNKHRGYLKKARLSYRRPVQFRPRPNRCPTPWSMTLQRGG